MKTNTHPRTTKTTKARLIGTFKHDRMEYPIDVPRGTRCTLIKDGSTAGKYWIDDLSWIDKKADGMKYHDAYFYGIIIEPDQVE